MRQVNSRKGLRRSIVAAVAASALVAAASSRPAEAADEVRALWVVRTTLTSPAAVETMVRAARAGGFNTLVIQVRGRADAYYSGGLEPRPLGLAAQPSFDPLATAIAQAHAAGLRVHADAMGRAAADPMLIATDLAGNPAPPVTGTLTILFLASLIAFPRFGAVMLTTAGVVWWAVM